MTRSETNLSVFPLIVDMDRTLITTDVSWQTFAQGLRTRLFATLGACAMILRGRAYFKRRITEIAPLDVSVLPLRVELIAYLTQQRARGRSLHLVSGADDEIVQALAAHVGLFESAAGSADGRNLTGAEKARFLRARFSGGFVYAGDSRADLQVWPHARGILVGVSSAVARRARALGVPVEMEFPAT